MSLDLSKLIGIQRGNGKTTAQCPVCQEKSHSHLVIFPDGKFGCVVDQSAEHRREIWAFVGDNSLAEPFFEDNPVIEVEKTWPLDLLDGLVKDYSYWECRGISAETVEPFRGGIATRFQMADRWVFPIFDEDRIIGFSGRALKPYMTRKWKHLGPSSRFIWGGLDEIVDRVILVESIGDSLILREHGFPANLCLFGTTMSQSVLGWLIAHNPKRIRISTNRDTEKIINGKSVFPGQQAAARIQTVLLKFFDEDVVSIIHPPEGVKDWGQATKEQIQRAFAISLDTADKEDTVCQ